jgi:U3 small nucleolar RNA-associated protein 4
MCLVLRDPAEFQHKPYKVPRLADLRLYTAGSDSGDITERCLFTGRILVCPSPFETIYREVQQD